MSTNLYDSLDPEGEGKGFGHIFKEHSPINPPVQEGKEIKNFEKSSPMHVEEIPAQEEQNGIMVHEI